MTKEQAQRQSIEELWRIGTCPAGEKCWCRTVQLVNPIPYIDDDGSEALYDYVIAGGGIDKHFAEHVVNVHNDTLMAST